MITVGQKLTPVAVNARMRSVRQSAGQSIPNNAETALSWNTTDVDEGGITLSGGTGLVAPVDGFYVASCTIRWASNSTGYRRLALYLGGALYGDHAGNAISGVTQPMNVAFVAWFAAGQAIEARVLQTSGGNLSIAQTSRTPSLTLAKLGIG